MRENYPQILIIEDNEDDEIFLRRALKGAGAEAPPQVYRTGEDAMAALEQMLAGESSGAAPPDLIFLDLRLPGMQGLQLLRWLRRQVFFEKVIVVLLTGSREEFTLQAAHNLGANTYISKPPSADSLRVILKALDRYASDFETGGIPGAGREGR